MKSSTIVNKAFSLLLTIILSFSLISSGSAGTSIPSGTAVFPGNDSDIHSIIDEPLNVLSGIAFDMVADNEESD